MVRIRNRLFAVRWLAACVAGTVLIIRSGAQMISAPTVLPLETLAEFRAPADGWRIAGGIGGDPRHQPVVVLQPGTGVLVGNPAAGVKPDLATTWEHADLSIDFDFMLTPASRFSVWLQGRYPVTFAAGNSGTLDDKQAPLADASRAPGLWQHVHLEFLAPKFDAAGTKTDNARFARVLLNGFELHGVALLPAPAPGASSTDERVRGPLVFRGEQGPVALRHVSYERGSSDGIKVGNLAYKLYAGEYAHLRDYDAATPTRTGVNPPFSPAAVEASGRFGLVFAGTFDVPKAGLYQFSLRGSDPAQLALDDLPAVAFSSRDGTPVAVPLTAGAHGFRLDYLRATSSGRAAFDLSACGPELAWRSLTAPEPRRTRGSPQSLAVDAGERVLVQRGFVPFEPKKRLYAISVGSPLGVHYAYDLETTALLRVWRGHFLDTGEMWINRGENQLAKPAGPALTLGGLPSVALIEYPETGGWPDRPDPLMSSQGYVLEPDGQPIFLTKLAEVSIRDRIAPTADGHGLTRRMEFTGGLPSWPVCVLLGEGSSIVAQPDGGGWVIDDKYYVDWPKDSAHQPILRTMGGRRVLMVQLSSVTLRKPIIYDLVW